MSCILAQLRKDLHLGSRVQRSAAKPQPPAGNAGQNRVDIGTDIGLLLGLPGRGVPTVAGALICQQESADAVAQGVAVIHARLRASLTHAMHPPATTFARLGTLEP